MPWHRRGSTQVGDGEQGLGWGRATSKEGLPGGWPRRAASNCAHRPRPSSAALGTAQPCHTYCTMDPSPDPYSWPPGACGWAWHTCLLHLQSTSPLGREDPPARAAFPCLWATEGPEHTAAGPVLSVCSTTLHPPPVTHPRGKARVSPTDVLHFLPCPPVEKLF